MNRQPEIIKLDQIGDVIAENLKQKDIINCYVGSNAAVPTASIEALTKVIKSNKLKLPFFKMIHLLLQGPVPYVEKGLQDRVMTYSIFSAGEVRKAANEGRAFYLPCTLAHMDNLIGRNCKYEPDVVLMKVRQNKYTGEYSLGLSVEALHTAIDHAKVVIAELDNGMPFTQGQSIIDAQSIDYLIEDDIKPVYDFPAPDFDNLPNDEKRIGELITEYFIKDGITLQVGIGKIPDAVVGTIKDAEYKDLGVQTEIYGDGLMHLEKMGIVTNRKKKANLGYSTTSLIMGSKELYDFVHMRTGVQMRPCSYTNSAEIIQKNNPFISVNTAIGVDLFGNVWADFVDPRRYYSGIGGQPDFIRAIHNTSIGTPIIAIKSITNKGEPKIVKRHPPGISLTASAYDGVVVVTEYGIADLRGLSSGNKALAIASIAHPDFRDAFLRDIYEDPFFTKPVDYALDKTPYGVTMYKGSTKIDN
ncbi:MAG: acetyl-CoA hydrolase/transferase C-terminal domain-containing protein [Desulfobacterales bacterium]|nr:acetyl-CoA hydrolase/transferase C-terminal domain-containing protein [Desulfobacterales bacterium]MDX2508245.1 acetyl-CoA hydrolase/transferase C-terminal domain-containing protein [Desulfobacterales bacterium]